MAWTVLDASAFGGFQPRRREFQRNWACSYRHAAYAKLADMRRNQNLIYTPVRIATSLSLFSLVYVLLMVVTVLARLTCTRAPHATWHGICIHFVGTADCIASDMHSAYMAIRIAMEIF